MNYDVSVFSFLDYTFSVPKNSAQTQVIKYKIPKRKQEKSFRKRKKKKKKERNKIF